MDRFGFGPLCISLYVREIVFILLVFFGGHGLKELWTLLERQGAFQEVANSQVSSLETSSNCWAFFTFRWCCHICWGRWVCSKVKVDFKKGAAFHFQIMLSQVHCRACNYPFWFHYGPFSIHSSYLSYLRLVLLHHLPPDVFIDMVHEFYKYITSYQGKISSLTTNVREVFISITPMSLTKILGIPFETHHEFPYPKGMVIFLLNWVTSLGMNLWNLRGLLFPCIS